jgi:hypothetical protein
VPQEGVEKGLAAHILLLVVHAFLDYQYKVLQVHPLGLVQVGVHAG